MSEIKDLTDELIKKQHMEWDEFTLFVRSHLYLEYYLNLAIKNQLRNGEKLLDDAHFTTYYKIEVLYGIKYLSKVVYHNCALMNAIRNRFAHELNPNDDVINDKIKKMEIPWYTNDAIDRTPLIDRYRVVSITMVKEIKNALEQNRKAMFYPDETEYDKKTHKFL